MNSLDENKKKIIDEYYGEAPIGTGKTEPDIAFEEKLEAGLLKMEIKEEVSEVLDINIMEIISNAEKIRVKKHSNKEFSSFILLSMFILSTFSICILTFGSKFFITAELILIIILPLSLLYFLASPKNRGDLNEK